MCLQNGFAFIGDLINMVIAPSRSSRDEGVLLQITQGAVVVSVRVFLLPKLFKNTIVNLTSSKGFISGQSCKNRSTVFPTVSCSSATPAVVKTTATTVLPYVQDRAPAPPTVEVEIDQLRLGTSVVW